MAKQLLLAGYLGAGNLGDDAVMLGLIHGLGNLGFEFTALSGAPEETNRLYNISAVPRKDMGRVKEAIAQCDALVFVGGSIFQDSSSARSVLYYATLVKLAKKAGKKVILVGQGVGPLTTMVGKSFARRALEMADGISVRDGASAELLKTLGVSRPARVTADNAHLLPVPVSTETVNSFSVGSMRAVGIAPRPLKNKNINVVELFGDLCRQLYQNGTMPILIAMDRVVDSPLIDAISKSQGGKIPDLRKSQTPMQLQQNIARLDSVIALRLHAGILATTVGVPSLMVSYDPKVTAFARQLDMAKPVPIEGLTAARLFESYQSFSRDRDQYKAQIEQKQLAAANLAKGNVELICQILR